MVSYLVVNISGKQYAIELDKVEEVVKIEKYSKIPGMPYFVMGFFNLRGNIFTMVELEKLFGTNELEEEYRQLIILKSDNSDDDRMAIVAHKIRDVINYDEEYIKPVPDSEDDAFKKYIANMYVDETESTYIVNIDNVIDLKED